MVWDKQRWAPENQPQVEGWGCVVPRGSRPTFPGRQLSTSGFSQPTAERGLEGNEERRRKRNTAIQALNYCHAIQFQVAFLYETAREKEKVVRTVSNERNRKQMKASAKRVAAQS
ncbi:hypothetical protein ACJ73_03405 [Blastomyces percursus]|uniref:Uncharacterized protein n=1 Tax=Blastomyces percursus TaxID=1658174 RepID=A0A1J9QAZ8_9EURO|nr:hypothetical protein ACJ73_03405 [Blastomyces percursus]